MGGRITGTIVFTTTLPEAEFNELWLRASRFSDKRDDKTKPWTLAEIGTPNLGQTPDYLLPALARALGTWPPQGGQREQREQPPSDREAGSHYADDSRQDEPPVG